MNPQLKSYWENLTLGRQLAFKNFLCFMLPGLTTWNFEENPLFWVPNFGLYNDGAHWQIWRLSAVTMRLRESKRLVLKNATVNFIVLFCVWHFSQIIMRESMCNLDLWDNSKVLKRVILTIIQKNLLETMLRISRTVLKVLLRSFLATMLENV